MTALARALDEVARVADAVLFEGYVLYPYRASAQKNQLRWQFGVLTPRDWGERASETWYSRTECLVEPAPGATLHARLRFLRLRRRQVQQAVDGRFRDVERLSVGDQLHLSWDEGLPETVDVEVPLAALAGAAHVAPVALAGARDEHALTEGGAELGRLVRTTWPVAATVTVCTEPVPGPYGALRLRVRVENAATGPDGAREAALRRSLIGAHSILALSDGVFVSSTDPPEWARPAVRACVNEHVWPVLAGEPARPAVVLATPIILADFPEIAPESPQQLYDSTENDEILTLRTMALTEAEKREARATDPRSAALVDAVDTMPPEIVERLHGAIRGLDLDGVPVYSDETGGRPWWDPGADASVDPETDAVHIGGHRVAKGSRVVLRPSGRADAQDIFLVGRAAVVQAVLNDVDGDVHLAVSLEDDPGAEFQAAHGRYRYFRPDEVEVRA